VHLGTPGGAGDKSESTSNHCRAVWDTKHLLWEQCWGARKAELLLIVQRFLKLISSVCILIYVYIMLPIYTQYIWTGSTRCLGAIQRVHENDDEMNTEIHVETVIEPVPRCTCRRKLRKFGDTDGGPRRVNKDMHCEIVIERHWSYIGGNHRVNLAAVFERVWRYTWMS
jgi:hypothetical protein